MTQSAITLAYKRTSPIRIPRRDLFVSASDSVWLEVSIVESDTPSAQLLTLTGGIGGPTLRLALWPDSIGYICDYGRHIPAAANTIFACDGTISATKAGTFDLRIPINTMANFPHRCRYAMQLRWGSGGHSEVLASGIMNIARIAAIGTIDVPLELLTDDGTPILV